jgi:hypothetical protein
MRKRAFLSAPLTRYVPTQAALAVSIALTAPVDSFLWGKPLWPVRWSSAETCSALQRMTPWFWQELEVLRFNVLDNRSSEWGTSAFHWCALCFLRLSAAAR